MVSLFPALFVLAGCQDASSAVRGSVAAFEEAIARRDAAAVCAALAPGTRTELESGEQSPCTTAVRATPLPSGGAARAVNVHGRQARAVLQSDTLFLSLFPGGWKVVAAGCTPQGDRPYACTVKGG
nr:hypothetical protein OG461_34305 [Streptomyces sp. NBC_00995]